MTDTRTNAAHAALPREEQKLPGAGAPTVGWTLSDSAFPDRSTMETAGALGRLHQRPVVRLKQVHLTHCVEITGIQPIPEAPVADGIITDRRDLLIGVNVADCLPLFLVSDRVVAVLHAGWRGVLGGILPLAVERLARTFGIAPDELRLYVGPGIGACCFEVSSSVWSLFPESARKTTEHGLRLDLLRTVNDQWRRCSAGPLEHLGRCTVCSQPQMHSYRRDRGQGRNFAYLYFD